MLLHMDFVSRLNSYKRLTLNKKVSNFYIVTLLFSDVQS